jgi:DNA-binding MarR family transcriptional regulator
VASQTSDHLLSTLHHTVTALVQRADPDLSARQLSVLLVCYLEVGPHTVRGLSERLRINKPAITRALDRLGELDLALRIEDANDRRSVNVKRTMKGAGFLRDLRAIMSESDIAARQGTSLISSGFINS